MGKSVLTEQIQKDKLPSPTTPVHPKEPSHEMISIGPYFLEKMFEIFKTDR